MYDIEVKVSLKPGMLNPEAATIERALALLDYKVSNTETIDIIKFSMNGNHTERLSQEGECRNEAESGILERASAFAHRVLEEIETLAGTTSCKSVLMP